MNEYFAKMSSMGGKIGAKLRAESLTPDEGGRRQESHRSALCKKRPKERLSNRIGNAHHAPSISCLYESKADRGPSCFGHHRRELEQWCYVYNFILMPSIELTDQVCITVAVSRQGV